MTIINKQKFLAELGRLLTFMSEEDRLEALTLYEKMFDDADDEQVLLSALQSPTRQAVVIARAYDAGARRQAADQSDEDDEASTPDFVRAILKVYEDNVPLSPEPAPAPVPEEAPVEEASPVAIENQVSLFEEAEPADEAPEESPAAPTEPSEPAEPTEEEKIAGFISDFNIEAEPGNTEEPEGRGNAPEDALSEWVQSGARPEHTARERLSRQYWEEEAEWKTVTNVPLLIFFVIFSLPLTVFVVALLLVPTLLSLLLSAAAITVGCGGLVAAFSGFAVFADILIVFGCALVALALGLFFLWLFIWFVVGPIAGLVRWVMRLGSNWCSKEVPA